MRRDLTYWCAAQARRYAQGTERSREAERHTARILDRVRSDPLRSAPQAVHVAALDELGLNGVKRADVVDAIEALRPDAPWKEIASVLGVTEGTLINLCRQYGINE